MSNVEKLKEWFRKQAETHGLSEEDMAGAILFHLAMFDDDPYLDHIVDYCEQQGIDLSDY